MGTTFKGSVELTVTRLNDIPPALSIVWDRIAYERQFRVVLGPWFLGVWEGSGRVDHIELDAAEPSLSLAMRPETVRWYAPKRLDARLFRLLWRLPFLRSWLKKLGELTAPEDWEYNAET